MTRTVAAVLLLLLADPAPAHANPDTAADAAFRAIFGSPPPIQRLARAVIDGRGTAAERAAIPIHRFDVTPDRLVPLSATRAALVLDESDTMALASGVSAIGVAYLHRKGEGWALDGLWPELLPSGRADRPANAGTELRRYGADPVFVARSVWIGMGTHTEWFGVIRLASAGPIAYADLAAGDLAAGVTSPTIDSPLFPDTSCPTVDIQATIGPPRTQGALFSVHYDGWTAPAGRLDPKSPLHVVVDVVPQGDELRLRPRTNTFECAR